MLPLFRRNQMTASPIAEAVAGIYVAIYQFDVSLQTNVVCLRSTTEQGSDEESC